MNARDTEQVVDILVVIDAERLMEQYGKKGAPSSPYGLGPSTEPAEEPPPATTTPVPDPAQLYEAGLDLVLWGVLFRLRDAPLGDGAHTGIWTLGYGLARLAVEAFRDTPPTLGPFSTPQLLTLPLPVVGLWLIARARRNASRPRPGSASSR